MHRNFRRLDTPPRRLAWKVKDAAEASGISRSKLYELMASGELPRVKIGRAVLIADEDLRALIANHKEA